MEDKALVIMKNGEQRGSIMVDYVYKNGDFLFGGYGLCHGWISTNMDKHDECLEAVKNVLERHGHKLEVDFVIEKLMHKTPSTFYLKDSGSGYNIGSNEDDMYYAYFSKEMHCAKSCANAVLKVLEGDIGGEKIIV